MIERTVPSKGLAFRQMTSKPCPECGCLLVWMPANVCAECYLDFNPPKNVKPPKVKREPKPKTPKIKTDNRVIIGAQNWTDKQLWSFLNDGKRRAKKYGTKAETWTLRQHYHRLDLFDRRCLYCLSSDRLSMDHVVPIAKGGAHALLNVAPACLSCNCEKGKTSLWDWKRGQELGRILGRFETANFTTLQSEWYGTISDCD